MIRSMSAIRTRATAISTRIDYIIDYIAGSRLNNEDCTQYGGRLPWKQCCRVV